MGKRTRGIFYLTLSIRGTNMFCINALVDCIAAGKIKKSVKRNKLKRRADSKKLHSKYYNYSISALMS